MYFIAQASYKVLWLLQSLLKSIFCVKSVGNLNIFRLNLYDLLLFIDWIIKESKSLFTTSF